MNNFLKYCASYKYFRSSAHGRPQVGDRVDFCPLKRNPLQEGLFSLREPYGSFILQVAHVYAEASLVYILGWMKNKLFLSEKLILQKLEEQSHTLIN